MNFVVERMSESSDVAEVPASAWWVKEVKEIKLQAHQR